METALPAPMTSTACDLRRFPFMALDVVRLRDSDLAAVEDAEAFRCNVILWCASWHQVPAASLPDDETKLARLAGYGRDVKTFRRARIAGGMRGWILCADSRWYHAVVAEKANEAYAAKLRQRDRTAAATAARMSKGVGQTAPHGAQVLDKADKQYDVTSDVASNAANTATMGATDDVTTSIGEDRIEEDKIESSSAPSEHKKCVAADRGSAKLKASRGSRLLSDWVPAPEYVAFARSGGLNAAYLAPRFRDFWLAKSGADATKVDWLATWKNWCRREPGWQEPNPAAAQPTLSAVSRRVSAVRTADGRELSDDELFLVST